MLWIGSRQDAPDSAVRLPPAALLRHAMALGSSGSGKTVFCKVLVEEAVRQRIPVIAVDPQGDLCSLALQPPPFPGEPEAASEYRERADVVIFTPAARKGVPLCADPVNAAAARLEPPERLLAFSRTAARIVSLLGYDLDGGDGPGLVAVLDRVLHELADAGTPAESLQAVTAHLEGLGKKVDRYARYLEPKKIRTACQRAARLDVGARRLLFHEGIPLDIDVLLGRADGARPPPGKSRVSVIFLNTLHSQEDKEFFVGALADRLYSWMLQHPSPSLQALFYIDEVAPYVPPVRKPACKDELQLLFQQARKFGVGCLMATQNPGDVDYKAMSQFGTWALGRLATRQDRKKVEPLVRSLAPDASEQVLDALPSFKPGELVLLSPDHLKTPTPLVTRRLVTLHKTLDEQRVEALAEEMRRRFAPLEPRREGAANATIMLDLSELEPATPEATSGLTTVPGRPKTRAPTPPPAAAKKKRPPSLFEMPSESEDDAPLRRSLRLLGIKTGMTAKEFARKTDLTERKARSTLRALVAAGHAGEYKEGRQVRYWAKETGARPDLGLKTRVLVVEPKVDRPAAEKIGNALTRGKVLGLVGSGEAFDDAKLVYRLLYRVAFEEKVKRPLLGRILGPEHEDRAGTLYLHPLTLDVLVFDPGGVRFDANLPHHASEVEDLDGAATFIEVVPGSIDFDEDEWKQRRPAAEAKKRLRRDFHARPGAVTPLFMPLWKLILRQGAGQGFRVQYVDALIGKPVDWPDVRTWSASRSRG